MIIDDTLSSPLFIIWTITFFQPAHFDEDDDDKTKDEDECNRRRDEIDHDKTLLLRLL